MAKKWAKRIGISFGIIIGLMILNDKGEEAGQMVNGVVDEGKDAGNSVSVFFETVMKDNFSGK